MKKFKKIILLVLFIFALIILSSTNAYAAKSTKKLAAPKNVKVSISGVSNVKVKWSKVKSAKKYTIYRATTKKGKYTKVGTSKTTSYTDKKTKRGKSYYYKVVANSSKTKYNSKKSSVSKKITVPSKSTALKAIRKSLKNKKWVNKNLKMTKNCFGDKINSKAKQQICFTKIKNKELVVVVTYCEEQLSYKTFLVGYYNGKVTVKQFSKYAQHYYHGGVVVDKNNAILCDCYMHMGYESSTYYKLSNLKFSKLRSFDTNENTLERPTYYLINNKKVNKSKYNKELKKYNKYKCSTVNTNLTNKNVDKYIK